MTWVLAVQENDRASLSTGFFPMLCQEKDLLEVAMLSLKDVIVSAESLGRPINSW